MNKTELIKDKFSINDLKVSNNCLDRLEDHSYCENCDFIPLCNDRIMDKISRNLFKMYINDLEDYENELKDI